jgi:lysozyme
MTLPPLPDPTPPPGATRSPLWARLVAAMGGVGAAGALLAGLTQLEGERNVGYLDIAGVPTACMGDTVDVVVGRFYTDAECHERLVRQALAKIEEVRRCTPGIGGNQLIAAGWLAYNIGGPAYCGSTAARRFNAGDLRGGCAAFAPWNKITSRLPRVGLQCQLRRDGRYSCTVPGLVHRRQFEMRVCNAGLLS